MALFGSSGSVDITQQLAQAQQNATKNRQIAGQLPGQLAPLTSAYTSGVNSTLSGALNTANTNAANLNTTVGQNTTDAANALRANVYGSTFNGLPAALTAAREAAAAGGGVQSGSYQNAVKQIGVGAAQSVAQGEAGIQAQGAQAKTAAATTAYQTVAGLSSKLTDDQLNQLSTVLQTGRTDLIQNAATQMGLNDQETQSLIDLMNFQQSQNLASTTGQNQSNQQLLGTALQVGGTAAAFA